jgi:hypothetical protein
MEYFSIIFMILYFLLIVFLFTNSCLQLSQNHGRDIRIVWYLFSLALVLTSIIILWAIGIKAIDENGIFHGDIGILMHKLFAFMLDLDTDLKIFFTILVVIILPQVISYFLSGLYGCATSPILIEQSIDFFVFSIIKSLSIASGIIFSASIVGYIYEWKGWALKGAISLVIMSTLLISASLLLLLIYREKDKVIKSIKKLIPYCLQKMINTLHKWFTRHSDDSKSI